MTDHTDAGESNRFLLSDSSVRGSAEGRVAPELDLELFERV